MACRPILQVKTYITYIGMIIIIYIFVEEMKILYIFVIFSTFRLIRFFPGGKVVMTTTADEPAQAVKIFNNMQG